MSLALEGCCTLLEVFDMRRSLQFYRDTLGFQVVAQSQPGEDFGWGLLRRGEIELMLNTAYDEGERPAAPDPAVVSAHAGTGLYFACRDLDGAYHYLRDRGVALEPPRAAPYGMKQLWCKDPDGYTICLQWPAGS